MAKHIWMVVAPVSSLALLAFLFLERTLVFRAAQYPWDNETNCILLVLSFFSILAWFVLACLLRSGKRIVCVLLTLAAAAVALMAFSLRLPSVRHKVLRYEVMERSFGLSHHSDMTRHELNEELLNKSLAPYLTQDKELLKFLLFELGDGFRGKPQQARIVYGAMQDEVSISELLQAPISEEFLIALLLAESEPDPWQKLGHLPQPSLQADQDLGFYSGFLTAEEARQVVLPLLQSEDEESLERLLFCALSFPGLFEREQLDSAFSKWKAHLGERALLAESGYKLRDTLTSWFVDKTTLKVSWEFEESEFLNSRDIEKLETKKVLRRKLLGLVRSCGPKTEIVPPEEAELRIGLALTSALLYEYERPKYELREVQTKRVGRRGLTHRNETRAVKSGTQVEYKWGASLELVIRYQDKEIRVPNLIVYWNDIVKAENHGQEKPPGWWTEAYQQNDGRTWPFGIRDRLFRGLE